MKKSYLAIILLSSLGLISCGSSGSSNTGAKEISSNIEKTSEEKPAVENKTPVTENKTPVTENKTPVAENKTPVVENKTPVVENKTPVVENKTPAVEDKTPVVEDKTPTVEDKMPAVEDKTPTVEDKTPVAENSVEKEIISGQLLASTGAVTPLQPSDINLLYIDGKAFRLSDITEHSPKEGYNQKIIDSKHFIVSNDFSSLKFGFVGNEPMKQQYFFVQGIETNELPKENGVVYQGRAIFNQGGMPIPHYATMNATVNFDSKNLTGTIQGNDVFGGEINKHFTATIVGNKFESQATANELGTKGGFFGKSAEEMGGVFYNQDNSTIGAFAGKKQ